MIEIGCCGWNYFNASLHFGSNWKEKFKSKLQAYATIFNAVEVNSTFYKLPSIKTAEKWREESIAVNSNFEFTLKVPQIITHKDKFATESSIEAFNSIKQIAYALEAKILLFQTPASFKPTENNLSKVKKFFEKIDREKFIVVWEVRWQSEWKRDIVECLFKELGIEQCVDPLRQECFFCKNLYYYRLHGFGKPMYNYKFSAKELEKLASIVKEKNADGYIFFNNSNCYDDAIRFAKMIKDVKITQ